MGEAITWNRPSFVWWNNVGLFYTGTCPANNYACTTGDCILNSWVCDGQPDCPVHGDDEHNCSELCVLQSPFDVCLKLITPPVFLLDQVQTKINVQGSWSKSKFSQHSSCHTYLIRIIFDGHQLNSHCTLCMSRDIISFVWECHIWYLIFLHRPLYPLRLTPIYKNDADWKVAKWNISRGDHFRATLPCTPQLNNRRWIDRARRSDQ